MIDDCGVSGGGRIVDEEMEYDESPINGASVSFVQEWINTYIFLSREFTLSFFCFPLWFLFTSTSIHWDVRICWVWMNREFH